MESLGHLKIYYKSIFPCKEIFEVFHITSNRELSFFTQQDAYMRYITCGTPSELHDRLQQLTPKKIDIGAIYSTKPSKLKALQPIGHELVFDIDLTDYPRECCDGKTICSKCYKKIKCAIKLLDFSLREEFGFHKIGFVFSGRRGLHCWVFDNIAMQAQVRNDIVKFYQHVLDKNLYVPEYESIMKEFAEDDRDIIKNWFLRIDKNVTTTLNHLVKLPFSVHPDLLLVAVPIDPQNVPELSDLPSLKDIVENPSRLKPYVEIIKTWHNDE